MVSFAGARDVESRAVVHARAEERQAHGYVHPSLEAHQLDRDVTLVMVLHDHHVELPLPGPRKDRVGRMRTRDGYPFFGGLRDGGRDALGVLIPEEAILARVGVEARDRDLGLLYTNPGERVAGEADHGQLALRPHPLYGFFERDVGADVNDA